MEDKSFFGLTEKQIEDHTAFTTAKNVLHRLTQLVEDDQGNGKGHFFEQFVKPVTIYGVKVRDLKKLDDVEPIFSDQPIEVFAEATNTFFIQAATVFAIDAIEEYQAGRTQHAWILANKAERYLGMAKGSNPVSNIIKVIKSDLARLNSYKSHKGHTKSRNDALKYYQDNIDTFSGIENAAEKIAEKVVKEKFGTVLNWIRAFHKENPSIPKPSRRTKQ